ncbi:MAG TPA: hypothetical protein VGJ73_17995 [Verrucomicrobiae bacterium]
MVAIMQVGAIVAGVLGAGVCHRIWTSRDWPVPPLVALLAHFGIVGLLVPLAWAIGAVVLQIRAGVSEDVRILMFWLGVLVLIILLAFVIYADVSPWLVFLKGATTLDDSGGGD